MSIPMTLFNAPSLVLALLARPASRWCRPRPLDDDGPAPMPRLGSAFTGEFLVFDLSGMRPLDLLQIQMPDAPCAGAPTSTAMPASTATPTATPASTPVAEPPSISTAAPPTASKPASACSAEPPSAQVAHQPGTARLAAEAPRPAKASTLRKQARVAMSPAACEVQAPAAKPVRLSEQLAHLQTGTPTERGVWAKLRGAEKAAETDAKRLARGAAVAKPTVAPAAATKSAPAKPTAAACVVPAEITLMTQAHAKVALFASLGDDTAGAMVMSGPTGLAAEQALASLLAAKTTSGPVVNELRAIRRRCEEVAADWKGTTADLFGAQMKGMLDRLEGLRGQGSRQEQEAIDAMVEGLFRGAAQGLEHGKPQAIAVPAAPPLGLSNPVAKPVMLTMNRWDPASVAAFHQQHGVKWDDIRANIGSWFRNLGTWVAGS
jgi:hypothetical protein